MSSYDEHLISQAGGDGEPEPLDLDAIQTRHIETTNLGEWEATRSNDVVVYAPRGFGAYRLIAHADARADAEFIAHARTDVPYLLALVREQQAKLDRITELAHWAGKRGWTIHPAEIRTALEPSK